MNHSQFIDELHLRTLSLGGMGLATRQQAKRTRFGAQLAYDLFGGAMFVARSGFSGLLRRSSASASQQWSRSGYQAIDRLFRMATNRGETRSMDHKKQIKHFVLENYLFTDDQSAIADGDSLIRNGIVDSTGMLELIGHLEETYSIKVENAEMIPANFDSIDTIGAFVASKLPA